MIAREPSRYSRRGELERRRLRWRSGLIAAGTVAAVGLILVDHGPRDANAEPTFSITLSSSRLREERDAARGELALAEAQLQRFRRVHDYSSRYGIPADLAAAVYDGALAAGIDADLAFRLVNVESQFKERALSPAGAVGLTQLMPATARHFQPGVTREQLFDRETNLRIGFRYLRALIDQYRGDVELALLVYNRGPVAVQAARASGQDPRNGYERAVLKGYRGNGVILE